MLTSNITLNNFKIKKKTNIKKKLQSIVDDKKNNVFLSLGKKYKYSFTLHQIKKYKKFLNFRVIGMGGSILGTKAIYEFLNHKIKKKFLFVDNLQNTNKKFKNKTFVNLVVSKSGNTIETIVNSNILLKKKDKNIFITENSKNYLHTFAENMKSEIIHHNNFIGGRYSVLSEVGMLPAELMGLKTHNFKQFNSLINNKRFLNSLVHSVNAMLFLIKKKNLIQL